VAPSNKKQVLLASTLPYSPLRETLFSSLPLNRQTRFSDQWSSYSH